MSNEEYLAKYVAKDKLEEGLKRLKAGEPVQYIVGNVDFYGYLIKVNKDVLIPRFETEELVSKTIAYINKYFKEQVSICDMGTGSGCIAITLKRKLARSTLTAIDISTSALKVAKENAKLNNAEITFIQNDLFNNLKIDYDVIISNPPYIAYDEEIDPLVYNNEPHLALFAKDDGLYFYKKLLKQICKNQKSRYFIAFEIGATQGDKIINYAKEIFPKAKIWVENDLQNRPRFFFMYQE